MEKIMIMMVVMTKETVMMAVGGDLQQQTGIHRQTHRYTDKHTQELKQTNAHGDSGKILKAESNKSIDENMKIPRCMKTKREKDVRKTRKRQLQVKGKNDQKKKKKKKTKQKTNNNKKTPNKQNKTKQNKNQKKKKKNKNKKTTNQTRTRVS